MLAIQRTVKHVYQVQITISELRYMNVCVCISNKIIIKISVMETRVSTVLLKTKAAFPLCIYLFNILSKGIIIKKKHQR